MRMTAYRNVEKAIGGVGDTVELTVDGMDVGVTITKLTWDGDNPIYAGRFQGYPDEPEIEFQQKNIGGLVHVVRIVVMDNGKRTSF